MAASMIFVVIVCGAALGVQSIALELDGKAHMTNKRMVRSENASLSNNVRHMDLDRTPSESALLRRRVCLVPGHLALPTMMEVVAPSQADSLLTCTSAFERARTETLAYIQARTVLDAADPDIAAGTGWVSKLEQTLQNMAFKPANIAEFARVIDDENLGSGLGIGVTWNVEDNDVFDWCNNNCPVADAAKPPCEYKVDPTGQTSTEVSAGAGSHVTQGDELLGATTAADGSSSNTSFMLSQMYEATRQGLRGSENIWAVTAGTVHEITYCLATDLSADAKTGVDKAIAHIEQQVPCVKFKASNSVPGKNTIGQATQANCETKPSIIFQSSAAGCWSYVGNVFKANSQPINIGTGCDGMGTVAHEIGHALGMLHEMSRSDREKWMKIQEANIAPAMMSNFKADDTTDTATDFDFLSLMMYGSYAFTTNGELTVDPTDKKLVSFMGQRMGFSELDVELLGTMYSCVSEIKPITKNKALSKAYLAGTVNTGFTGTKCEDSAKTGMVSSDGTEQTCDQIKKYCTHPTMGDAIKKTCPVSCYMCIPGKYEAPLNAPTAAPAAARRRKAAQAAARTASGFHGSLLLAIVAAVVLRHF